MSTVQELNRYQRAIEAIAKKKRVTGDGVCEWLKKHEGIGCSKRDATNEVRAWRLKNHREIELRVEIACFSLLAITDGLTRDGRKMFAERMKRLVDWHKIGNATDEAVTRANTRRQV